MVRLDLSGQVSHVQLVLPCSGRPEDAPGGAGSVPCAFRDGAPRGHERRADQSQRRLRQPPQHVATDERGRRRGCRGGLRALPDGRDGGDGRQAAVGGRRRAGGTQGAASGLQSPRLQTKTQCPRCARLPLVRLHRHAASLS